MSLNLNTIKGDLRPIGNRVIVSDMYFGEQKTRSGLIISNDDGTTRGIYPRWGRVYAKGPDNKDEYSVGDWILIEHGRWTRGVKIDNGSGEIELRMVEAESVLAMSDQKPDGVQFGEEFSNGDSANFNPESFINR
jgi:co-chaperonin GroES (HSP10)